MPIETTHVPYVDDDSRKRRVAVTLPEDLAYWVESRTRRFPDYLSRPGVIRDCIRKVLDEEQERKGFYTHTRIAWESLDDDEIRDYARRAYSINMGTIDIRLNGEDAHRVIVELDHARAHRDLLNLQFQSVWLENMRLKRKLKEVSK